MLICSCLCNLAGHGGQCQGTAEPGLRLPHDHPRMFHGGVCRACSETDAGHRRTRPTGPRSAPSPAERLGAGQETHRAQEEADRHAAAMPVRTLRARL